jgi:hypothetical protein
MIANHKFAKMFSNSNVIYEKPKTCEDWLHGSVEQSSRDAHKQRLQISAVKVNGLVRMDKCMITVVVGRASGCLLEVQTTESHITYYYSKCRKPFEEFQYSGVL